LVEGKDVDVTEALIGVCDRVCTLIEDGTTYEDIEQKILDMEI
jgi:hypothetical protein